MKRFYADTNDEKVGSIYKTYDYSKFKLSKINRALNIKKADELADEIIKGSPLIEPIQVTRSFEILDGQHRFYALRKTHKPVYYYIDNQASIEEASELNSKQRNWKVLDYLHSYCERGIKDYQALATEINRFNDSSATSLIIGICEKPMMHKPRTDVYDNGAIRRFKEGKFRFNYTDQTHFESFLQFVKEKQQQLSLSDKMPVRFQEALAFWFNNPQVNKNRLYKIITFDLLREQSPKFPLNVQLIGKAYNKGLSSNRINYYITNNGQIRFEEK